MAGNLPKLISNAADRMKVDLQDLRDASGHAGLKGDGAEAVVASFLRQRLPNALGVTSGHVVDATGQLSKQADVIIYDAMRTPVLFTAAHEGWDVVPAEGVIAVIEVKMRLTASMLEAIVANADSVHALARDAYLGAGVPKFDLHGQQWSEMPIIYSVFAFESDNAYAFQWNELLADYSPENRIASVCALDRGVSLSLAALLPTVELSPTPTAFGLIDIDTTDALLLWFTSLSAVLFQATHRPIDLMRYAPDQHRNLAGRITPDDAEAGRKSATRLGEVFMKSRGLPAGIVERIFAGQALTPEQEAAMRAAGATQTVEGGWSMPK